MSSSIISIKCKIYFLLSFSTVFLVVGSSFALTKSRRGERCLKAIEEVQEACSGRRSASDANSKIGIDIDRIDRIQNRKCTAARKKEKVVCSPKILRCDYTDSLVCGALNRCASPIRCTAVLEKLITYKNVCEFKKSKATFEKRGDCFDTPTPTPTATVTPTGTYTPVNECNDKSRAVCGQIHYDCVRAPCIQPPPQWFQNICELNKQGARHVADELCNGCVSDGKPVCGQPKSDCTDVMCLAVQQLPRWYKDKCELLNDGASELSPDICGANDECLGGPLGKVCGIINPPCTITTTGREICSARRSIIRWFDSLCELVRSGAEVVDINQCENLNLS